jgi:nucleoside-diphosphate-sugar epimerase
MPASPHQPPRRVLVTGAGGNLGTKLVERLVASSWCERIVALDRPGAAIPAAEASGGRVVAVGADLRDAGDRRWRDAVLEVDAIVHFAAQNPYPDAPWRDAAISYDITLNLVGAAALAAGAGQGSKRVVFASSNHVMGRYKDAPLADGIGPGTLTTDLEPAPGTRWHDGQKIVEGSAYGVSKLMGERLCVASAALTGGALTAVAVRVGWCQPGENRPQTINPSGVPTDAPPPVDGPDAARDLAWFRGMWLSNRDFGAVMERALVADPAGWPAPGIVVNGMSANRGMAWDIEGARRLIGYEPQDDLYAHVAA